jgi:hypothetical protein
MPLIGIFGVRLDRGLVTVPPHIALRRLDLDDIGAEVGEDHGRTWRRDEARQIDDLQA